MSTGLVPDLALLGTERIGLERIVLSVFVSFGVVVSDNAGHRSWGRKKDMKKGKQAVMRV